MNREINCGCENKTYKKETQLILNLDISNDSDSIEFLFKNYFSTENIREFKCQKCCKENAYTSDTSKYLLRSLPDILVLRILRINKSDNKFSWNNLP